MYRYTRSSRRWRQLLNISLVIFTFKLARKTFSFWNLSLSLFCSMYTGLNLSTRLWIIRNCCNTNGNCSFWNIWHRSSGKPFLCTNSCDLLLDKSVSHQTFLCPLLRWRWWGGVTMTESWWRWWQQQRWWWLWFKILETSLGPEIYSEILGSCFSNTGEAQSHRLT